MARYRYEWQNTEHGRRVVRTEIKPKLPDLASLKKDDLVALAEARGVEASGTKAEIAERLSDDDED